MTRRAAKGRSGGVSGDSLNRELAIVFDLPQERSHAIRETFFTQVMVFRANASSANPPPIKSCLLYTSDAADE